MKLNNTQTVLSKNQLNILKKNQRTMKIDSVYKGPSRTPYMKSINGSVQRDKRLKMSNSMTGVNERLDSFQNLRSSRKKPMGFNTSRSKVSTSTARINMRTFKPQ